MAVNGFYRSLSSRSDFYLLAIGYLTNLNERRHKNMDLTGEFICQEQKASKDGDTTYLTVISVRGGIPFQVGVPKGVKADDLYKPLKLAFSNFAMRAGKFGTYYTADNVAVIK